MTDPGARTSARSSRFTHRAAILAGALCLVPAASALAGDLPTAEEVFAKYTTAIGGDALENVKNVASKFTFSAPEMGLSTTGEAYQELPGKSYSTISLMEMGSSDFESGVNGDIVWQNNPQMGLRLLKGEERRGALMASRLDPFSAWKQLWEKAEMAGEETVGEASCYKVVLTPAEGEALSVWFDTGTGLVVQQEIAVPATGGTVLTQFSDYRDVHGIKAAHRIEQQGLMHWVMEVTEVRYNVDDIPEGVFDLPPRIEEMAGR